jgi:integrase/recombinase XerC
VKQFESFDGLAAAMILYVYHTPDCRELKGPLFRTIARGIKRSSDTRLPQTNTFQMVRRRAAEIETAIGNHCFRASGITAYLKSGDTLERPATIAHHTSTPAIRLDDQRPDKMTLDEVELVLI